MLTLKFSKQLKPLDVSNGTIEVLKWIALALMTLDHVNTFLYERTLFGAYELGRLSMPLFSFVFAFNLARPNALKNGVHGRMMQRLAVFGLLATPFYMKLAALPGGWLPLNIMFTFFVATAVIGLFQRGRTADAVAGILIFLGGGAVVDYQWYGLILCFAAWWYCRAPGWLSGALLLAAAALLYPVNGNFWAMAAVPLMIAAPTMRFHMPRLRYAFYIYYPAHLVVLTVLARLSDIGHQ